MINPLRRSGLRPGAPERWLALPARLPARYRQWAFRCSRDFLAAFVLPGTAVRV